MADQPRIAGYAEGINVDPGIVRLTRTPSEIVADFEAPRDGTYRFGVAIQAAQITPLAPGMPRQTAASLRQPLVLRYPYDWTWRERGNVLSRRPWLVMPGVVAGGRVYLVGRSLHG